MTKAGLIRGKKKKLFLFQGFIGYYFKSWHRSKDLSEFLPSRRMCGRPAGRQLGLAAGWLTDCPKEISHEVS